MEKQVSKHTSGSFQPEIGRGGQEMWGWDRGEDMQKWPKPESNPGPCDRPSAHRTSSTH